MREESGKTSRDELDEYIRVSSPGLLIIVGALTLVLAATVVWGFTGTPPVTLTVTGCVIDSENVSSLQSGEGDTATHNVDEPGKAWVACFVDSSTFSAEQILKFKPDVTITMPDHTNFRGTIEAASPYPLSRDEVSLFFNGSQRRW